MPNPTYGDITVAVNCQVATVELHRPPHNYFDEELLRNLNEALRAIDNDPACRASVLVSEGKSFCAGTDFTQSNEDSAAKPSRAERLYAEGVRLFSIRKPVVAAIQGAAVGGGLGLALFADFRVVSPEARFAANFVKIGIHPGFGLTYTLPRLIGSQRAALMFYTGRRITGEEAVAWGLADALVPADQFRVEATKLASEIAEGAPLAIDSTRTTMRKGLADAIATQLADELIEQSRLRQTEDHREGVQAVRERRPGRFLGR